MYHLIGHSGSTGLLPGGPPLILSGEPTMYGGEPFLVRIGAVYFSDSDTDLINFGSKGGSPQEVPSRDRSEKLPEHGLGPG